MTSNFDYTTLVDKAMRRVVYDVLRQVVADGLPEPHHFFVTFRTDHPGVVMSDMLRSKYPHEITIVLQHQFRDLKVEQEYFRVTLSFSNIPEKLTVPFDALTGFADPSVKFGLQFHANEEEEDIVRTAKPLSPLPPEKTSLTEGEDSASQEGAKVFTLDAFRKK